MKRFIFILALCLSVAAFGKLSDYAKPETAKDESSTLNDEYKTDREICFYVFSATKGIPQGQVSNNIPVPSVRTLNLERRQQNNPSADSTPRIRHSNIRYFARCSFLGPHPIQSPASAMVLMLRHLII